MPKATVNPEAHHFDLETCPPDGFVSLRTLSFHEMELRKDIAGRMYQEQSAAAARKGQPADDEMLRAYFEAANVRVTEFEFRNCIQDHNLYVDDAETQLIDFTKPMSHWFLDPKIGEEISKYIAKLTQIDETDVAPLPTSLSPSSSDEIRSPDESMVTS